MRVCARVRLWGLRALLVALVAAAAALPAHAQAALSLREAVARGLAQHPLLAAEAARVDAAEGARAQAAVRPNPRLFLQSENLRGGGDSPFRFGQDADTFAYVSQLLEVSGRRGHRIDAAGLRLRRAQLERELLQHQIASRIKLAYWAAAGAQRIHELLAESRRNFQQVIDYHEVRVREGAMAEADLLRVRLEGERLGIASDAAALDAQRSRIHLFREMGQAEVPAAVRYVEPLEPAQAPAILADSARALAQRLEVQIAQRAVEQGRAALGLQQAAGRPDLDLLFGFKRTTGFNSLMAGVQVNLPLADRNQGNIASAAAEVRVAEAALLAAQVQVRLDVKAAAMEYDIWRQQITQSLPALRSRAGEIARIAQAAYREGGTDLLRLLDAERVRIDAELLYYRTLASYQQSVVALEAALGTPP